MDEVQEVVDSLAGISFYLLLSLVLKLTGEHFVTEGTGVVMLELVIQGHEEESKGLFYVANRYEKEDIFGWLQKVFFKLTLVLGRLVILGYQGISLLSREVELCEESSCYLLGRLRLG